MFTTLAPLSPDLTADERLDAIREAYNEDRSQMTLMLAHKLRVPEVDILRALEGDTANWTAHAGKRSSARSNR
jgi:hypothetical protein